MLFLLILLCALVRPASAADAAAFSSDNFQFTPEDVVLANNILLMLDRDNRAIHRWDLVNRRYLASLPLQDRTTWKLLYAPGADRIYTWNNAGEVYYLDPASGFEQKRIASGLLVAAVEPIAVGDYVLAYDGNMRLFAIDGSTPATFPVAPNPAFRTQGYYDAKRDRVYAFGVVDGTPRLHHVPVTADGQPLTPGATIRYDGTHAITAIDSLTPSVFMNSGLVFHADTGEVKANLGREFADFPAAWLGGRLYTLEYDIGGRIAFKSIVTLWDEKFQAKKQLRIDEEVFFIGTLPERNEVVVLTRVGGVPRIRTYTAELELTHVTEVAPRTPNTCYLSQFRNAAEEEGIAVRCNDGIHDTQIIERSSDGENWEVISTIVTSNPYDLSYEDGDIESGPVYHYRIYARNEAGRVSAVKSLGKMQYYDTRGPKAGPEPGSLALFHQYRNEVFLSWSAGGNLDTLDGFMVERTLAGKEAWTTIARLPRTQTNYRAYAKLDDEAHYQYRVRGFNAYGVSLDVSDSIASANAALPERRPPPFSSSTRFDSVTGVVNIPCLRLLRNAEYAGYYKAALAYEGGRLRVTHSEPLAAQADCTGVFDVNSGIYRDTAVRSGDKVFSARLQRQADNRFTIEDATFEREGPTYLWKVSNGDKVLYLGGTPQHLHKSELPLPKAFGDAAAAADLYVAEAEPLWYEPIYNGWFYTHANPNYLRETLAPEILASFRQVATWLSMDSFAAALLKPQWIQEHALSRVATKAGFTAGADDVLWVQSRRAETLGKLATTSTVRDVPPAETEAFLLRLLASIRTGAYVTQLQAASQHWRDGDRTALLAHLREYGLNTDSAEYRQIVAERDAQWLPKLLDYAETPETELIIVDALHLTGPGNLLERLEAKGYSVTQQ
ncbi:MAG: TraB/GumN family protein [Pseudomonadota bacterium]